MGQLIRPIEAVGVYVPGGKAAYPSSILMNCIPAQVAGVKRIALVTPAMQGHCPNIVLATAALLGIEEIYQIGGAQAIAALAFGTEFIPAVNKIVGPGNAFVAEAKKQVFGQVGIDMIAGPSEVVIIADEQASADWLIADLFAQAEHDEQAMAILISHSGHLLHEVLEKLPAKLEAMPRKSIIQTALKNHGALIKTQSVQQSIQVANDLAAEHLELCINDAQSVLGHIHHAGAVFLGYYTPESFGDYLAGTNHVLPTGANVRFSSGLSVYDFQKRISYVEANEASANHLFDRVDRLAMAENLPAHALSARLRQQSH